MQDGIRRVMTRDGDNTVDLVFANMDDLREVERHCELISRDTDKVRGDIVTLAEVPGVVLEKYCNERGVRWDEFMKSTDLQTEFINSEYAKPFRIWGRTGNKKF